MSSNGESIADSSMLQDDAVWTAVDYSRPGSKLPIQLWFLLVRSSIHFRLSQFNLMISTNRLLMPKNIIDSFSASSIVVQTFNQSQ